MVRAAVMVHIGEISSLLDELPEDSWSSLMYAFPTDASCQYKLGFCMSCRIDPGGNGFFIQLKEHLFPA